MSVANGSGKMSVSVYERTDVDPSPLRAAVFLVVGAVPGSMSTLGLRKRPPATWNENLDKYTS